MQHQNYEKWSEVAKRMQEPLQEMAELNMKTLRALDYLKPEDLTHIKKPEELLEKQVNVLVQNGHKTLDYMQKSFQILEKAMLGFVQESKKAAVNVANK
jgi:hypothetical protein